MKTMWRSVSVHGIAPLSFRFTMVGVSLVPHGHWYRFAPTVTYGVEHAVLRVHLVCYCTRRPWFYD